ncbi:tail fiber protein [Sphingomonas sp. HF-S3]|uniref:Tail fiber protein n=1 Tax=Sphingomonas rustica TaxID=3103142 RepID=A0ABV0B531_9SPHN
MSNYYVGEIRLLAFDQYTPVDFLPCDGRAVSISQYQALFSLIGTTYGGNGQTTFNLPDLRGRSPVSFGQTAGGTNYALGQSAGAETVTLTSAMVPAHTHTVSVTSNNATATIPTTGVAPGNVGSNFYYCNESQAGTTLALEPTTIQPGGGLGQAHLNVQPSIALCYAIATGGLYPEFPN